MPYPSGYELNELLLQANLRRFQSLVRATSQAVWIADPAGQHFTVVGGTDLTDRRKSKYTFAEALEVIHPDDRATVLAKWDEAIRTKAEFECVQRVLRPGGWRMLHLRAVPVFDDADQLAEWVGTSNDITDMMFRRQAEQALRESEERFQIAFMKAPYICALSRVPEAIFVEVNEEFERVLGYTREEVVGKTSLELGLYAPERREQLAAEFRTSDSLHNQEVIFHTKSGDQRVMLANSNRVQINGQPYILSAMQDITERRKAERQLEESEQRLRAIIDNEPECVKILGADCTLLEMNPAGLRMIEADSFDKVRGRNVLDLIRPEHRANFARMTERASKGEPGNLEFEIQGIRGTLRWLETRVVAFRDVHSEANVLGITRDITERKRTEKLLRTNEERLRLILDNLQHGLWDWDITTGQAHIDDRWKAILGYPQDERRPIFELWEQSIHPEDKPRFKAALQHHFDSPEQICDIEYRVRTSGGEWIWLNTRGRVIERDLDGKPLRMLGTIHEVTERKLTEAALIKSEAHMQLLVRSANVGLWDWNQETNQVIYSTEWKAQIGYADHEISNDFEEWRSRIHPEDLHRTLDALERYLANPVSQYQAEFRLRHRDGSYRWILAQASLVEGSDGRRLIGSHFDITDRVSADESLRLRDRAIQCVTEGIVLADATQPDDPIIYVSPGFERLTGYTASEMLGRNCRFLQGPKTDKTELQKLREALRAGRPCKVELFNYRKDGSSFWNELSISPVWDETGRLTHFVGVQTDVTARRSLEEQLRQSQKMEAIGQLAGGVAHDFNNLLTVINGYSAILLESLSAGDPMRELLVEISKAGERAGALTRQLLTFSRRQILDLRVLSLNAVVSDAEKMLRRLIGEDVMFTTILAPGLASVKADAGQVEQILLNLSVNARDAMPRGGKLTIETQNVTLDEEYCSARTDVRPGEYVLLAVSDTGHGMDEATRLRIFEPFFTTKEFGKGTGLGLATVHGIVRQSGGHIAVYSEVGLGTTFKVYLPQVVGLSHSKGSHPGTQALPRGSETVLLVEDEDAVRALGRVVLGMCGYTVLEASDGRQAVQLSESYPDTIHLLMSDVVMPILGGRELAERIHSSRPECKILFLSGYTDDAVIRHGILEADFAFLQKPFTPFLLANKVRSVLDESQ